MNAERILTFALLATVSPLAAQQSLEYTHRTTGPAVTAAFEEQRAVIQTSSAVIYDGRREINYGVVVSPDGHILTKASEIEGIEDLSVTVDRTNYPDVKILATDPAWDVALLKVDAEGLVPVEVAETSAVPHGTWVVATGVTSRLRRRALAGVISANSRPIPAEGGVALGVVIAAEKDAITVGEVVEDGAAEKAGIEAGDVILSIDGHAVKKVENIAEILAEREAGDLVEVFCRRGEEEMTFQVTLAAKNEMFTDSMNRNDMMSGDFSRRRSGFARIIQHDILGASRVTGGPLLDLRGRCIGMNIARANRAESFAIPVEELREIAGRLMKPSAAEQK
ncbi:MAG TPA: PDZ domain-containing protein [Luteolibacter sp.]|nr:PDZ domain-containing protein [Luteolibacter sp.]